MAESPSSNNTPIWVAMITVAGSVLSALVVNADKWMPQREETPLAPTPAAVPPPQAGSTTPKLSATGGLETPVEQPSAVAASKPIALPRVDEAARSSDGTDPPEALLEDSAVNTVRKYFAAWSNPNDPDGRTMSQFYGSTVNFYGKQLSQHELMGEKARFARRWPTRSYAIRPDSLRTQCSQQTRACTVMGRVDWQASSSARSSYASGTASFTLVLDGGVIITEDGRVITRN